MAGGKRSTRSSRRGGATAEFYELDRDNLARIKVGRMPVIGFPLCTWVCPEAGGNR